MLCVSVRGMNSMPSSRLRGREMVCVCEREKRGQKARVKGEEKPIDSSSAL